MEKKSHKLHLKKFLKITIQILWDGKITKINTKTAIVCYLIYYFQYLSLILRVSGAKAKASNHGLLYFSTIIEAFNGTPLLKAVGSESLCLGLLLLFSIASLLIYVYIAAMTIASLFFNPFSKNKMFSAQVSSINKLIQLYLSFFQWVSYTPLLEFYLSLSYSCGDERAILPSLRSSATCSSRAPYIVFFSVSGAVLNVLMGVINLWAFRTYDFLEKNPLRVKWSMMRLGIFILRTLAVVAFVFIDVGGSRSAMIFVLMDTISIITLWEFAFNNPIRDIFSSKDHFGIIVAFASSVWLWTVLEYTSLIELDSAIYVWFILICLSWRLGWQFIERSRTRYLSRMGQNNSDVLASDNVDFALEELVFYSLNNRFSQEGVFLVNSLIKQHLRLCNIPRCPIKGKYFTNFMECDLQRKMELVSLLAKLVFKQYIKQWHSARSRKLSKYERIALKYFSFLIYYNSNPIQSVFELHSMSNKSVSHTLYFRICSKLLSRSVRESLSVYEFQQISANVASAAPGSDRTLNVKLFAEMELTNRELTNQALKLIARKLEFLETFKNGFGDADSMISMTRVMVGELLRFRKGLAKYDKSEAKKNGSSGKWRNIFLFKFISLYESILTNNAIAAIFYEDEVEKIRTVERSLERKGLNLLSIVKGEALILEASYLSATGKLIKHDSEKKFAQFFGYEKHEAENIKSVNDLMPEFLSHIHTNVVNNYINKTRNLNSRENVKVSSYAMNAQGFIFPVSVYPRVNIGVNNDFVIQAAVLRGQNIHKLVIADKAGFIQGVNSEFMRLFERGSNSSGEDLKPKDLTSLNLFFIMPQVQEQLKKSREANPETKEIEMLGGLSDLFIPNNLADLINAATKRTRTKSIEKGRGFGSESLGNTLALNAFSSKYFFNDNSQTLSNSNSNLLNSLGIDMSDCKAFRAEFHLRSHTYSWGTKDKHKLEIFSVEIVNMQAKSKPAGERKKSKKAKENIEQIAGSKSNIKESVTINKTENLKPPKSLLSSCSSFVEPQQEDLPENFVVMPPVNNHVLLQVGERTLEEQERVRQLTAPNARLVEERTKSQTTGEAQNSGQLIEKEKQSDGQGESHESFDEDDDEMKISREDRKSRTIVKSAGHKTGSVSSKTTSSVGIFSLITRLQGKYPGSVLKLSLSMVVELLMLIVYCTCFYSLSGRYVETQFEPLRKAMANFGSISNGFSMAITVSVEFHFRFLQMTSINSDTLEYLVILNKTTSRAFDLVSHAYNDEIDNDLTLQYQRLFHLDEIVLNDTTARLVKKYPGRFFIVDLLELLYKLKMDIHISKEMCELAPRNFLEFNKYLTEIRKSIKSEFFNSNQSLQSIFMLVFVVCAILSFVLRLFDFIQLKFFYRELMKIISIFLRISANELTAEIIMLREVLNLFDSSENTYMNVSFPNIQFSGRFKSISFIATEDSNLPSNRKKISTSSAAKSRKNLKTRSQSHSIQPPKMSKKALILAFSYILVFSFFIGIYLYWNDINNDVKNLIDTNIFIADIFSIPNTLLSASLMILENKIIQKQADFRLIRESYLEIFEMYHELSINMERYIFLESKSAEQRDLYQTIMRGNLCSVVEDLTDAEYEDCRKMLNMALAKGLVLSMNEMESLLSFEQYYDAHEDQDIRDLGEFVRSEHHFGVEKAAFYLNKVMDRFRSLAEEYYREDTLLKIDNLKLMILVITLIMILVHLAETYIIFRFLRDNYRDLLILLKFIPYNKLIKDDQIKFLIRNLK